MQRNINGTEHTAGRPLSVRCQQTKEVPMVTMPVPLSVPPSTKMVMMHMPVPLSIPVLVPVLNGDDAYAGTSNFHSVPQYPSQSPQGSGCIIGGQPADPGPRTRSLQTTSPYLRLQYCKSTYTSALHCKSLYSDEQHKRVSVAVCCATADPAVQTTLHFTLLCTSQVHMLHCMEVTCTKVFADCR